MLARCARSLTARLERGSMDLRAPTPPLARGDARGRQTLSVCGSTPSPAAVGAVGARPLSHQTRVELMTASGAAAGAKADTTQIDPKAPLADPLSPSAGACCLRQPDVQPGDTSAGHGRESDLRPD
jgi:hypothetical protein